METTVLNSCNLKVPKKIRKELVSALKDSDLEIGNQYLLSSTTESPIFDLTIKNGTTTSMIRSILAKGFGENNIKIKLLDAKTLKIEIGEDYIEKISVDKDEIETIKQETNQNNISLSVLKDNLLKIIQQKTGIDPVHDYETGFNITLGEKEGEEIATIICSNYPVYIRILKALKNDSGFSKKISYDGLWRKIYVANSEKPYIPEKIKEGPLVENIVDVIPVATEELIKTEEKPVVEIESDEEQNDSHKRTVHPGLVTTERKNLASYGYVHMDTNYGEFNFLYFNRKRKKNHTNKIVESIKKFGVLSFVTIVITDCIDGTMKKYIVDGQHRFDAFVILGLPILYVIAEANSKEELVQLIAELNRTSKNWSLRDYLKVWSSLGIDQYLTIEKYLNKTRLPITLLLEMFSGLGKSAATKRFQDGKFRMENLEIVEQRINWIMEIRKLKLLPKSRDILTSFVAFLNKTKEYDNEKMKVALQKMPKTTFYLGEKTDEITNEFKRLYLSEKAA